MAQKESHVFKYYDRPNLFFDCQITISVREPQMQCEVRAASKILVTQSILTCRRPFARPLSVAAKDRR